MSGPSDPVAAVRRVLDASALARRGLSPETRGPLPSDPERRLERAAAETLLVLYSEGPLTVREIVERTALPPATVRHAFRTLGDEKLLQRRYREPTGHATAELTAMGEDAAEGVARRLHAAVEAG